MNYTIRLHSVSHWIQEQKLDALLIDNPVDLLYLTGLNLSLGRLIVVPNGATLFVDGRYFEAAKKQTHCKVVLLGIDPLVHLLHSYKKIGFDSAFTTIDALETLKEQIKGKEWISVRSPLKSFRVVKEKEEIALLKKAAQLTWAAFQHIFSQLKEGVTEAELALEFEIFCKKRGASDLSFSPIIAFGENSAYPHYRSGKTKLKKNQIVLMDVGAVVDAYRGDMTRTFFFGEPDPKLYHFWTSVKTAQEKAVAAVRPGIAFGDLDKIARDSLKSQGIDHLFTHGLSHGLGLETHEYPFLKIKGGDQALLLEPGMVFTVEPGVYLPGLGGVRIEDTVMVTQEGVENFYPMITDAKF
jgi:Xaa-Pro aminopeptidase